MFDARWGTFCPNHRTLVLDRGRTEGVFSKGGTPSKNAIFLEGGPPADKHHSPTSRNVDKMDFFRKASLKTLNMELLSEISGEQLCKTNVLFVPLVDNSRWDSAKKQDSQCINYRAPMEYINFHPELNAEVQWETLSDYFTLSRNFSTYADREDHYWSGYCTTMSSWKNLDAVLKGYLRVKKIFFGKAPKCMNNILLTRTAALSLPTTTITQVEHPDTPTRVVIANKPGPGSHARRRQEMLSLRASKPDFIENHNFHLNLESSGEKILFDLVLPFKISGQEIYLSLLTFDILNHYGSGHHDYTDTNMALSKIRMIIKELSTKLKESFFSTSVEISGNMRPFVALTFVMGCAQNVAVAGTYAGLGLAEVHGLGYAAAPVAGVALVTAAAAPIAYGAEHYSAGPVVSHAPVAYAEPAAPAPYTTATQGAGVITVHQSAPVVTKQVHLDQTSYVSGYATKIHKPATPHLPIAVPTVLEGTQTVNAPIVKTQTEIHNVQSPVFVKRKVDTPYDAPFYTQGPEFRNILVKEDSERVEDADSTGSITKQYGYKTAGGNDILVKYSAGPDTGFVIENKDDLAAALERSAAEAALVKAKPYTGEVVEVEYSGPDTGDYSYSFAYKGPDKAQQEESATGPPPLPPTPSPPPPSLPTGTPTQDPLATTISVRPKLTKFLPRWIMKK